MSLIDRSTDIRAALRRRQGGFLMNPFRFGGGSGGGGGGGGILYIGSSYVGSGTNVISLPSGWAAGDVAFALNGSNTVRAPATGFTSIRTDGYTNLSYRVLQSGDGSFTFTSSDTVGLVVYRGVNVTTPYGGHNGGYATYNILYYYGLTMSITDGSSYVFAMAYYRSAAVPPAPTGLTSRASGAAMRMADSNSGIASYSGSNHSISSVSWASCSVEIIAA